MVYNKMNSWRGELKVQQSEKLVLTKLLRYCINNIVMRADCIRRNDNVENFLQIVDTRPSSGMLTYRMPRNRIWYETGVLEEVAKTESFAHWGVRPFL